MSFNDQVINALLGMYRHQLDFIEGGKGNAVGPAR